MEKKAKEELSKEQVKNQKALDKYESKVGKIWE